MGQKMNDESAIGKLDAGARSGPHPRQSREAQLGAQLRA